VNEVIDIYQQARVRARRTAAFRLRRQLRRLSECARQRRLTDPEIARLAAVRSELRHRRATRPRRWSLSPRRRSQPLPRHRPV